jgi:hypothetical protein
MYYDYDIEYGPVSLYNALIGAFYVACILGAYFLYHYLMGVREERREKNLYKDSNKRTKQ